MISRPGDLIEIPPLWRTVLYYLIAEAIIVCGAVTAGATGWNLAQQIAAGNAILFFGTAAAKVSTGKQAATDIVIVPDAKLEPLPSQQQGYMGGV